jgi:hypothetical protein
MKTYFLSYARTDDTIALKLADDLIAAGVQVWVDQYDIQPSQHWDRAVEAAVRGCEGMIVVLSPRSAASPTVADEVSVAIDMRKELIPVLIEPCVLPLRMTRMQFIDAARDYDAALRRCLATIQGQPRTATPPPTQETRNGLPTDVLTDAERRLTGYIGPIAKVLVRQAGAWATSESELYAELAAHLPTEAERTSFLGWIAEPRSRSQVVTPRAAPADARPPPEAAAFTPEMLEAITRALMRQLGPIAAQLVARETRFAASREELCQRLSERIPAGRDRFAFLKETGVMEAGARFTP